MAKYLISIAAVLSLFSIILGPSQVTAAPAQTVDHARRLGEGLNVMYHVAKSFGSRKVRFNMSGACHVVDHLTEVTKSTSQSNETNTEDHTLYSNEDVLAAVERIRNDTCVWLNTLSEGIIEECSKETLETLCIYFRIYEAAHIAKRAITVVNPNERQWIEDYFDGTTIKNYICGLPSISC